MELIQTELIRTELVETELVAELITELKARAKIRQLEELKMLLMAVHY